MESSPRDRDSNFRDMGKLQQWTYWPHLPQFMSQIPELRALVIDALTQDWQGRSMYMFPPFPLLNKVIQKLQAIQDGEIILIVPWWLSQPWFPHLLRLCVWTTLASFHNAETYCHNRVCLGRQVVPSARMEALMQHYQATRLSEKV